MSALESSAATSRFDVEFSLSSGRLRATVTGDATFDTTVESWRRILVEVRRVRPGSLLLLDELRGPPLTEAQWRALVEAMKGQGLESARIAHVKPLGRKSIEYCEIFAREAGIDARVFDDEAAAALWLDFEAVEYMPGAGTSRFGAMTLVRERRVPGVAMFRISGEGGDPGAVLRLWQHLIDSARLATVNKVLVEMDVGGPSLSEQEMLAVVTRLAGIAPSGLRIALLEHRHERQNYDELACLMALDRGFSMHVFANASSALLWLRHGAR